MPVLGMGGLYQLSVGSRRGGGGVACGCVVELRFVGVVAGWVRTVVWRVVGRHGRPSWTVGLLADLAWLSLGSCRRQLVACERASNNPTVQYAPWCTGQVSAALEGMWFMVGSLAFVHQQTAMVGCAMVRAVAHIVDRSVQIASADSPQ